ncbi:MAG: TldD/PmbA family protein [Chloroflexota bacterium]|nr:TldD/PmbA family protein [Dehalococcoidia bacterium]MDW8254295.1 TldD/PmbA family protein [Chloroflexota bacterium]
MRDVAQRALDTAISRGAQYADVRVVELRRESVAVKNGAVDAITSEESAGFGVRVVVDGAWGFASSAILSTAEADRVAALAVAIGRASALLSLRPVTLGPPVTTRGRYVTPVIRDPFTVSLEERLALLLAADEAMRRQPAIVVAEGRVGCERQRKLFLNSEGADVEQELTETGVAIECTARAEDELQTRSYPNSFGLHMGTAGWEFVEQQQILAHAERIADEAAALLTAKQCPPGVTTVILDSSQTALQVHESCGHAIELDRVFGSEAAYAGTSFLTPDKLGTYQYGSEHVTIVADATIPGGLGTFGFDDEGVPAQRTTIVDRGRFVGYLTSRETAAQLGQASNGTMRADGWNRLPLIRMTNINLEPGTWTLEDLIADTDEGILMQTNRSWSIDDRRWNFQFGTQIAWEIRGGKRGALLKNATYAGITPEFWRSCDAVCNREEWIVWGLPNCGKGQPPQTMHVGHGAAPARFRNVRVGLLR